MTLGDLVEPPPPTELTQAPIPQDDEDEEEDIDDMRAGSSAKIDELIHLLQLTPDTEKSLVFSQFTSFLDKVRSRMGTYYFALLTQKSDRRSPGESRVCGGYERSPRLRSPIYSIPYIRFDGKMSARRRQEAIARFSVPLDGSCSSPVPATTRAAPPSRGTTAPPASQEPEVLPARRRTRKSTATAYVDGDAAMGEDAGDADYSFVEEGDDDDFIDDEDDEEALRRKSKSEKGKGKAKKQARISVAPPSTSTYLDGSAFGTEVNPKVMLLSLKAGALGLNLTVANNVFL